MKNGEVYRGQLSEAEETMNCQLKDGKFLFGIVEIFLRCVAVFIFEVTMTARDGRVTRLENVFLRGGHIKFIVLPELLKSSPLLKKIQVLKSKKLEGTQNTNGNKKSTDGPATKKARKN